MMLQGELQPGQPASSNGTTTTSGSSARGVATLHVLKAAELGHALAQHACGQLYARGAGGVEASTAEAARWYRAAAAQGHSASGAELALLLERAASAPQHDASAQYELALLCRAGRGVALGGAPNDVACARWLEAAAAQGHVEACFALALCYDAGRGVNEDALDAAAWFKQAAEQGHGAAMFRYAECLRVGRGELQDAKRANEWCFKAAAKGCVDAQYKAALLCEAGYGSAPANLEESKRWMALAAQQGHDAAERRLLRWGN